MIGMRYPIEAAIVGRAGVVLAAATLSPWIGITWSRRGGVATVEAAAGARAGAVGGGGGESAGRAVTASSGAVLMVRTAASTSSLGHRLRDLGSEAV